MLKRSFSGAIVGLAASLGLATAVHATTLVTFDDRNIPVETYDTEANAFTEQGVAFAGEQFFFVPAGNPYVTFPTGYSSVFMETALEPVMMSLASGNPFDFLSIDLGLGEYNEGLTDTVAVIGTKAGCTPTPQDDCTVSTVLTVGNSFSTFNALSNPDFALFTHLSQISFGAQQLITQLFPPGPDSGFLAFDNIGMAASIVDSGGSAAPEPSAWAMMIVGFGGIGGLMRRRARQAAVPA